jgi:GntR family transcriptional regulator/MocR family aminotransferase
MEEPGYPDARNIFALRAEHVQPLPVDEHGLVVSSRLENLDYVYTTPSHQSPTTVTMPLQRRQALLGSASDHDFLVIEDDYETGTQYVGQAIPALKSLDKTGRVIYVGSLSKSLAPGLRLGYMVASEDLIHEARALRRLILRHPPVNNQLAIALFLSQGHHDLLLRRLRSSYQERWRVLGDALAQYLPELTCSPSLGGSSYWLSGPPRLNCKRLQREAALSGVLIEPGDVFFMSEDSEQTYLRLGFSSIPVQQIEPGIKTLAKVVRAQL